MTNGLSINYFQEDLNIIQTEINSKAQERNSIPLLTVLEGQKGIDVMGWLMILKIPDTPEFQFFQIIGFLS